MRVSDLLKRYPRHELLPRDRDVVEVDGAWYWGRDVCAVWERGKNAGRPKPIPLEVLVDCVAFERLFFRVWYDVILP